MEAECILKVPQTEADEHVLVNVKKNGVHALDLRLVATDGSDIYISEGNRY